MGMKKKKKIFCRTVVRKTRRLSPIRSREAFSLDKIQTKVHIMKIITSRGENFSLIAKRFVLSAFRVNMSI